MIDDSYDIIRMAFSIRMTFSYTYDILGNIGDATRNMYFLAPNVIGVSVAPQISPTWAGDLG